MKENNFESDIPFQEILEKMRKNTFYNFHNYNISSINNEYLNLRTNIFKLLQNMTMRMNFKSQTYFLSAYYLDILFMKKKKINFNLYKIGLAALCLSSKFCENDPNIPQLQYFVRNYNSIFGYKNTISMSDLMYAEVLVCKLLNYKLNYYTMYDFNAFFFCHGILKLDQIKEIEKDFKNNNKVNNQNLINTLYIKNILGKIYNKSRNYLDIIIKVHKICFKYSPLFIVILIIKNSIEEILRAEYKKYFSEKNENSDNRQKFLKKNYLYFKEIMNDFYKIDYESSEQYKQLIMDDEIKNIFNENNKNNIKDKNDENNKENKIKNDKENDNNKIFNSSVSNNFYRRLKISLNNDINNNIERNSSNLKRKNNFDNSSKNLDSNLNINEIRKSHFEKKNNTKKTKKIPMPRKNTYNTLDNNNINENKNHINKNNDKKTESNSPIKIKRIQSNKYLNYEKINKNNKQKNNTIKTNKIFDSKEKNEIIKIDKKIKKKAQYLKKLIYLNNKEISNSLTHSINASTTTHFYSSKINQILSSNNTYLDSNNSNSIKILISEYANDKNKNSKISSSYNKIRFKKPKIRKKFLNTSIGKRYKKRIKINTNDISHEMKNKNKNNLNDKKNNFDKDENAKFSTSYSFYPSKIRIKIKKINENNNKEAEPEIQNINIDKEIQEKRLSLLLARKNSKLNNSLKEINKCFGKNSIDEDNKLGCITSRYDKQDEIYLNIVNKNKKANKFKKIDINKKVPINTNNKNNTLLTNKNRNDSSINVQNKEIFKKKISFKYGINSNSININNMNNGSLTTREHKLDSNKKINDNFQSSINQIIQQTKNNLSKNKKEKNEENKVLKSNFYISQENFYKSKKENKDKNIKYKNENNNKDNSYSKIAINKIKNNQNKKNSAKNIINNNININMGNKTKKMKLPELNLNNAVFNPNNNYILNDKSNTYRKNINNNINFNNNSNACRKNINNIVHKLPLKRNMNNKSKKKY